MRNHQAKYYQTGGFKIKKGKNKSVFDKSRELIKLGKQIEKNTKTEEKMKKLNVNHLNLNIKEKRNTQMGASKDKQKDYADMQAASQRRAKNNTQLARNTVISGSHEITDSHPTLKVMK